MIHFVANIINPEAGKTQPADAHQEQQQLKTKNLATVRPISPREAKQPPDQRRVRGRRDCGGEVSGRQHLARTLLQLGEGARNFFNPSN
jgi:hypothetical protein